MSSASSIEYFDVQAWLSPPVTSIPSGRVSHPVLPKEGPNAFETLKSLPELSDFTGLISSFPDLVRVLESKDECTVFALPNSVLRRAHPALKQALIKDLGREQLSGLLQMHISPDQYMPSTYMATAPNLGVMYSPSSLNGVMVVNSKALQEGVFLLQNTAGTTSTDVLCANGVIHTLDSPLFPPPTSLQILSMMPSNEYSTFQNAMRSTGLEAEIQFLNQKGGILFIPTNTAFASLGVEINEFLFPSSPTAEKQKVVRILLKYHIVLNETFYSNIHFKNPDLSYDYEHAHLEGEAATKHALRHISGVRRREVTSWLGPRIVVDLKRDGGLIDVRIDGRGIGVRDGNARDGVLHVLNHVLIPPKRGEAVDEDEWVGKSWGLRELEERLGSWL